MPYPPTPPLLLTRRLSSFLHSSLATIQEQQQQHHQPALQTALLITPSGKLLAYESPVAVRTLRTQSSVAASLWAIHATSSPSVAVALGQEPPSNSSTAAADPADLSTASNSASAAENVLTDTDDDGQRQYDKSNIPVSIAASFNGGAVFVVRRLRCGLLFACATPPPATSSRPATATALGPLPSASTAVSANPADAHSLLPPRLASAGKSLSAASSSHPSASAPRKSRSTAAFPTAAPPDVVVDSSATAPAGTDDGRPGTATDAASFTTTGTTTTVSGAGGLSGGASSVAATVAIVRRQVEELARLLDEKLGALSVPEENIGVNGFR
ncbi:hypothetical protein CMQ_3302 [Grosmannia clavigera kw1407]|uniref:Uncharacterized protein n=1 Tax=Grosmannia clavigera (strain kw1407 / UAMH 11150) TaxID=655863 RepID=F0X990_GROCL|nr:uncharacterized protein CMQ_3302 [Grosmannia clavigera kw1407]EFX05233.1 hypothetical protein CMQ_3302 [Grosmannia clavigera kw1407]